MAERAVVVRAGIELVVVAAGAGDGEDEKGFAEHDLFANEAVVGKVVVEGAHSRGSARVGFLGIELVTGGFGETGKVEPVVSPALAVVGRGESGFSRGGPSKSPASKDFVFDYR